MEGLTSMKKEKAERASEARRYRDPCRVPREVCHGLGNSLGKFVSLSPCVLKSDSEPYLNPPQDSPILLPTHPTEMQWAKGIY